jgi:isomerase DpgB
MVNELVVHVDGSRPLSAETVLELSALCDRIEDADDPGAVTLHVTGFPEEPWARDLTVTLVNRWERTLRRLERAAAATVAIASGDCGGTALDVLLVADVRFATPTTRLLLPIEGAATWPGMALYRLAQQAGVARIRRAVLYGAGIGADEALALNLVDEIVADPAEALVAMARLAATLSGPELAIRRQLMLSAPATSFEDALGPHLAACDRLLRQSAEAVS